MVLCAEGPEARGTVVKPPDSAAHMKSPVLVGPSYVDG